MIGELYSEVFAYYDCVGPGAVFSTYIGYMEEALVKLIDIPPNLCMSTMDRGILCVGCMAVVYKEGGAPADAPPST